MWSLDSFFYAFILFGMLFYWIRMNNTIINGTASEHWPDTLGKVDNTNVVMHTDSRTNVRGGSTTTQRFYEVIPNYSYAVEGNHFTSDKATSGGGWFFGNEDAAKQTADSLRSVSALKVFYDPSDPSNSVLERGIPERDIFGFMFAIPATGGAAGMAFNHFLKNRLPEIKRRRNLSIQIGIAMMVVSGILEWLLLELTI